ncbi:MAG: Xaa-Pro aminopeptidase [Ferrovum sp. 37-45-19]|nr:MAG: Xaa-Pro aminopeptidase [Ferrovum sp. 21-44-67]OYV94745.1 MAG: Xaa-Pro aminopeptidase [Ferrovum sp. 37-45-19]HQT81138.1 aminopeptidase P N-terminal domain-containing protein [Ferrovaceae bacterium]HQU06045.1 aminopeptidase P N-terminal domain-containing protein [Ferrovaceae bacterium]
MIGLIEQDFKQRRQRLARTLKEGVFILCTAPQVIRNADTHFNYRWDSNFHYLTGFKEPNAVLLMIIHDGLSQDILFCQPKDPDKEIWDGLRLGPEAAVEELAMDEAYSIHELNDRLSHYLTDQTTIFSTWGNKSPLEESIVNAIIDIKSRARQGVSAPSQWVDVLSSIHEMRLIKDSSEIAILRHGANIAARAHNRSMLAIKDARYEYEIEAVILHEFKHSGADAPAYPSIVAAGNHATILHYIENNGSLNKKDLMLIDAGCEWQGYASDITRTFPMSGSFSGVQKELYEIVLDAQMKAIDCIKPGIQFNDYHLCAVRALVAGLIDLKLCTGTVDGVIESGDYRRFYMHRTGHWLGRDVHDVGQYSVEGQSRRLEPGMVMTVEPGLYIRADSSVPEQFHGIGIRIEDDVLVTHQGVEILTNQAYKTVDEIESWMNQ